MKILGIDGSPHGPGKTAKVVGHVLEGAASQGAAVDLITCGAPDAVNRIAEADAVVFGSPTYRASHSSALRVLLEKIDRDGANAPLLATPAAVVMTGGSMAHFLGTEDLAGVLRGFFGTQVLAPSLFFHPLHFDSEGNTVADAVEQCRTHGAALWELAAAVRNSTALKSLKPLV
ncbi:NAD(P)H-dependent oxidoreductase [Pseudarthrobacter sp. NPDC080039]|uniref:NADPH-dependent FMN reductase n=1 Tax=unclassified Pseudarthrobacter TaxID=2647000 RepID=UPI00344ED130